MAMDGNAMGVEIWAAIKTLTIPDDRIMTDDENEAVWKKLGTAIVAHITANGTAADPGGTSPHNHPIS